MAAITGFIAKEKALAYLMFNLYTPPCFAALGAMNSGFMFGMTAIIVMIGIVFGLTVRTQKQFSAQYRLRA